MEIISSMKKPVMKLSRAKKLDHFYSLYDEGAVLDVGVSGWARVPGENIFADTFRYPDHLYTGLGVEDMSQMRSKHPGKRFVEYQGGAFPFEDKQFEWCFSNAVIEHVGDADSQVKFINEMLRVGEKVFFTTPNKFFPVESHTNTLFMHWLPGNYFYNWCSNHKPEWNYSNLVLLSCQQLANLLQKSNAKTWSIQKNRFMGLTMTFTVTCDEQK